jgi:hypothetical protein
MNSGTICRSATEGFRKPFKKAAHFAEASWVRQGRRALFLPEGVKFSSPTYIFAMTNRFQDCRRNPLRLFHREHSQNARQPALIDYLIGLTLFVKRINI